jgi:hypothetical protein
MGAPPSIVYVAARVPMFPDSNIPYTVTDVPGVTKSQHTEYRARRDWNYL